jgi:small-conductance mechanosensitive channel
VCARVLCALIVQDVVFWIVLLSAVLWIFDVPVIQVYVPLGTVLVSASFAIGNSLSNIVTAFMFVLVVRPYNVGDRITASGVLNGAEPLVVKRVDVLTTTFVRIINKEITVPNHQLMQMAIENFKRSPPAIQRIDLAISYHTTALQLEGLRRRINGYLETQPLAWRPTCLFRTAGIDDQKLLLVLWMQSHYSWQDVSRLFKAVFALYLHVLAAMRDMNIQFRMAEQTLHLEGSIATHFVPGAPGAPGAVPGPGAPGASPVAATATPQGSTPLGVDGAGSGGSGGAGLRIVAPRSGRGSSAVPNDGSGWRIAAGGDGDGSGDGSQ